MELHFYAPWQEVEKIYEGKEGYVYTKDLAEKSDIHVSFNRKEYYVISTPSPGIFAVLKRVKINWEER